MPSQRPLRGRSIAPRRTEGGRTCIDIRVKTARQLFDYRDPAPFRERDLDEDAVDYVVDSAEEAPPHDALKLVVWIAEPTPGLPDEVIVEAIRSHFDYLLARVGFDVRRHVRQGQVTLVLGFAVLASFLTMGQLCALLPEGMLRSVLEEGFAIAGWVAMWRPVEVLLYGWWPLVRSRKLLQRIRDAEMAMQHQLTDAR